MSPKSPQPFTVFPILTSPFTYLQASLSPSNNLNALAQDMFSNCPKFHPSLVRQAPAFLINLNAGIAPARPSPLTAQLPSPAESKGNTSYPRP